MVRFYHQCANILGTHCSQVILIQQNGTKEIGNETKPIEVEGVIRRYRKRKLYTVIKGERQLIEIPLIPKLIELHSKNIIL